MELKNQVVSLETAKQLKSLGVKQESIFYWMHIKQKMGGVEEKPFLIEPSLVNRTVASYQNAYPDADIASAYTVAELGEMLPERLEKENRVLTCEKQLLPASVVQWAIKYQKVSNANHYVTPDVLCYEMAYTEADARGKMLIYLLHHGLQDK